MPLSTLAFGAAAIGGRSAPYRVLEAGDPTGEVRLLTAEEAEDYEIAQPGGTARRCRALDPSGCGKTTLLRIIAGLEMPDPRPAREQLLRLSLNAINS